MKKTLFSIMAISLLLLMACNGSSFYSDVPPHARTSLHVRLEAIGNAAPTPENFTICHAYGCAQDTNIQLSTAAWQSVIVAFEPQPQNAVEERAALRIAIAQLEILIGEKTGTSDDRQGTFTAPFATGQMDCEDEMLNTATYLRLLEEAGYLNFHHLAGQAHRGAFINGWPHMATRIQDNMSNDQYVVDSWFHDNGVLPEIIPVAQWQSGWKPDL